MALSLAHSLTCYPDEPCGNGSLSNPEQTLRDVRVAMAILQHTPLAMADDLDAKRALQVGTGYCFDNGTPCTGSAVDGVLVLGSGLQQRLRVHLQIGHPDSTKYGSWTLFAFDTAGVLQQEPTWGSRSIGITTRCRQH